MSSHSGVIEGWLPGQLRQCMMHSEVKSGKNSSVSVVVPGRMTGVDNVNDV